MSNLVWKHQTQKLHVPHMKTFAGFEQMEVSWDLRTLGGGKGSHEMSETEDGLGWRGLSGLIFGLTSLGIA